MADSPDPWKSLLEQWPLIAAIGAPFVAVAGLWRRMGVNEAQQDARIAQHDAELAEMRNVVKRLEEAGHAGALSVARMEVQIAGIHETLKRYLERLERDRN
jgi:outer membrane protein TolC